MDITPLFKACVKTVRLSNKSLNPPDKNRILQKTKKDELSRRCKDVRYQVTQLRNFLIENRAAYMQFACHLKRSVQMSNEERNLIDRESEKIIQICTQLICEIKLEYDRKSLTKQQHQHVEFVFELLTNYLKSVYNVFNDQKNYRIKRDLETFKFLKLDSEKKKPTEIDFSKIEYKDGMDFNPISNDNGNSQNSEENFDDVENFTPKKKAKNATRKSQLDEDSPINNPSIEDDANSSNHIENTLSAEDIQMFELENKQLFNELKGLTEEVEVIEKNVYDIAKLQELFSEKVRIIIEILFFTL